ncbi:MAG TPA: aminotransferase class V-fold PLP-dependent enzyme [Candidatus Cybelea sp.]|jgi:isopenicillin-N epimerase|nr:aminotransferase class V-fold PLP-dependent enzyme [Candidatus Cybelea sp.]
MTNAKPSPRPETKEPMTMPRRSFVRGMTALGLWPLTRAPVLASEPAEPPAGLGEDDPGYWRWVRQQFCIPLDEAYFNTGTLGACPRQVLEAVLESMREMEKTIAHYDYRPEHPEYIAGYRAQEDLRKKAGGILNASAGEIALVQNATMAINFIANGLELKPGDEVLITDQEHPGSMGPWDLRAKRQGIVVKKLVIPIPTPDPQTVVHIFADAIGPRTKAIAVPHVTSHYGIVLPVREICDLGRARSIFTLVDGAQAVGQMRVDVKKIGCDAYACSPHKWLLAPPGNGLLYVRQDRENEIWATLASAHWDDYQPETGMFRLMQFGTANEALLDGLNAALDFYNRIGPEKIERRTLSLAGSLRQGLQQIKGVTILSPVHPALAGAIVTYGVDGLTGLQLQDELWSRKKYRVRAQAGPMVRQSVHFYNSPEEIAGTLAVVKLLAAR